MQEKKGSEKREVLLISFSISARFVFAIIDITRDPCRVREITYWFNDFKSNYFFWRNTTKAEDLIDHFETYIAPLLED